MPASLKNPEHELRAPIVGASPDRGNNDLSLLGGKVKRTRTTITYTTRETLIVKRNGTKSVSHWCVVCDASVEAFTLEGAALILEVSPSSICQQIAERQIHFIEGPDKAQPLICFNSLLANRSLSDRDSHVAPILRLEEKK